MDTILSLPFLHPKSPNNDLCKIGTRQFNVKVLLNYSGGEEQGLSVNDCIIGILIENRLGKSPIYTRE